MDLFSGFGDRPVLHSFSLCWGCSDLSTLKYLPKEGYRREMKLTRLCFNIETILQQLLKKQVDMGLLLFKAVGENEDVTQINKHKSLSISFPKF